MLNAFYHTLNPLLESIIKPNLTAEHKADKVIRYMFEVTLNAAKADIEQRAESGYKEIVKAHVTRHAKEKALTEWAYRFRAEHEKAVSKATKALHDTVNHIISPKIEPAKMHLVTLNSVTFERSNKFDVTAHATVTAHNTIVANREPNVAHTNKLMLRVTSREGAAEGATAAEHKERTHRMVETVATEILELKRIHDEELTQEVKKDPSVVQSELEVLLTKEQLQQWAHKYKPHATAKIATFVMDMTTAGNSVCMVKTGKEADVSLPQDKVTISTFTDIIKKPVCVAAQASNVVAVHLLLQGCKTEDVWTNLLPKLGELTDAERTKISCCFTTSQFPSGAFPLVFSTYGSASSQMTDLSLDVHKMEARRAIDLWDEVYERDANEDTLGLPRLIERLGWARAS